jgi:hypothetical protein
MHDASIHLIFFAYVEFAVLLDIVLSFRDLDSIIAAYEVHVESFVFLISASWSKVPTDRFDSQFI